MNAKLSNFLIVSLPLEQIHENDAFKLLKISVIGRIKEKQTMYGDIRNITQLELTMFRDSVLSSMDVKRTLIEHKNTNT